MAVTPKALVRTTLTASSATLYTVPAATYAVVTNIILSNTTASAVTTTLVFDGVSLLTAVSVPANSTTTIDLRQVLATTKTITGLASTAAAIGCHISGTENT